LRKETIEFSGAKIRPEYKRKSPEQKKEAAAKPKKWSKGRFFN